MGILRPQKVLSSELGARCFFVHPPEPNKELLMSNPTEAVYLARTSILNVPYYWNFKNLINPHISVVGVTGAGKSYLVKTFLTRANLVWNTNALILDWVGEYNKWVKQVGGKVVSLGKGDYINLLDLAGMKPLDRAKQIMTALEILTDLGHTASQKRAIEDAIENAYKEKGFDLVKKDQKREPPLLKDVIKNLNEIKRREKSEAKRDEINEAISVLSKFIIPGNDYFAKKSTLKVHKLISSGLVCLDLHGLPSEQIRSLAGLTILQFIKEMMRDEGWHPGKGIKLFIVADEAWKIAKDERSDLITIVREGRKYQFSLIVASQNPTDVNKAIFSNVGTMFVMRLLFKEFKDYVRSSLNYSDFIAEHIGRFGVGECAVYQAYYKRTSYSNIFLLSRIDGEEPLITIHILVGDKMDLEFEKESFRRKLLEFGLTDKQVAQISMKFEKNDNRLNIIEIISDLEKFGYARSVVITFLRELGIRDIDITSLFSELQRVKMGVESDKISKLEVD
ncbi:ATP-binding protein [Candidatus Micrarchaeota archaeon]|nr:ATP-binding protein [Candidatus Micrarchaeota archaeon]